MKLVLVEWVDAVSDDDWECRDLEQPLAKCVTLGILRGEYEDRIEVTQTANNVGHCCGKVSIPIGCIKRIRNLKCL
jgi:hypothetical protein